MRFTEAVIADFKNHALTKLEFADMTVLFGPAGAGKSSALHALTMALIGRTPFTDLRGAGAKEHIRLGQEKFSLDVSVANGRDAFMVSRSQTQSKQTLIVPWGQDLKGRQALLLDHLGVSDELIEVLLDPRLFSDRKPDEQRQVLLKIVRTPTITVPDAARAVGITSIPSVGSIDEHIDSLKEGTIRDLNRTIKELTGSLVNEPSAEDWEKYNALKREHGRLAGHREGLSTKIGRLTAELKAAKEAEARKDEAEKAKVELAYAEGQLATVKEELNQLIAEVRKQQATVADGEQMLASAKSAESTYAQQIEKISGMGERCGVVEAFTCPLGSADKAKMLDQLIQERNSMSVTRKATESGLQVAKNELEIQSVEGRKLRETHDKLTQSIAKLRGALEVSVATLQPAVEIEGDLRVTQAELQTAASQATDIECQMRDLNTESKATEARRQAEVLTQKRTQLERAKAAVESLEVLKGNLLKSEESAKFYGELNAVWGRFYPGGKVMLSGDAGLEVVATNTSGNVQAAHLSSGQKVMLDAALRIAAAKASGFGILAMDDANKLPDSSRRVLWKSLQESGCQCILLHTTEVGPVQSPKGVAMYRLSSETLTGPVQCLKIPA